MKESYGPASSNGSWQNGLRHGHSHLKPRDPTTSAPSTAKQRTRFEPRYQIVAICFLATFTAYVERVGFSIAYTEMAKTAAVDEKVKGTVLSAFYWGYGLSQVSKHWSFELFVLKRVINQCSSWLLSISQGRPHLFTPHMSHCRAHVAAF